MKESSEPLPTVDFKIETVLLRRIPKAVYNRSYARLSPISSHACTKARVYGCFVGLPRVKKTSYHTMRRLILPKRRLIQAFQTCYPGLPDALLYLKRRPITQQKPSYCALRDVLLCLNRRLIAFMLRRLKILHRI